ncbi:putative Tetratricopeptide repeat, Tetratricopeptide-like helical protein [Trachipleistophora hominis]|uniref:Putative Tetratricopeptide repeat, Tetratricopeptide-like helical protein n=1 Tax=Trachipleistophora hominis TaxID=72359 RepID=L7K086_TRAHO|nr:putative Tetratricopeptide repeat, Tetratricopeptide-like helical protein [Trachipleistophora hominis]
MDKMNEFILTNLKSIKLHNNPAYRPGIARIDLIEQVKHENVDFITYLFIMYKCSVENEKYKNLILENIDKVENLLVRANVLIELDMLSAAEECLERYKRMIGISLEVIGAQAVFKKYNCVENVSYVLDVTYRNGEVDESRRVDKEVDESRRMKEVETGHEMSNAVESRRMEEMSDAMQTNEKQQNGKTALTNKISVSGDKNVQKTNCSDHHAKNAHGKRKLYKFETRAHVFKEYRVFPLHVHEQCLLLTIVQLLIKSQGPEHVEYARAYLDRVLFNGNDHFDTKDYLQNYYKNVLYDETIEPCYVRSFSLEAPLVLNYEYAHVLGNNFFKKYFFDSALGIFTCLRMHEKMAKCYLGMGKETEMIEELERMREMMEIKVFGRVVGLEKETDVKEAVVNERLVEGTDVEERMVEETGVEERMVEETDVEGRMIEETVVKESVEAVVNERMVKNSLETTAKVSLEAVRVPLEAVKVSSEAMVNEAGKERKTMVRRAEEKNEILKNNVETMKESENDVEMAEKCATNTKTEDKRVNEEHVHGREWRTNNNLSEKGCDTRECSSAMFDLVNTYNLLAELTGRAYYYALSYQTYKTYTPLKLEALHRIRNKEYEKALALLKQALEHAPYNITLLHMTGCLETALHGNGITYFLRILSIDSNNYETLINTGNYYTEKEKYEDAVYFYTRAYKINKSAKVLKHVVTILEMAGKYDEIRKMLSREDRGSVLFAKDKEIIAMFDRYSK